MPAKAVNLRAQGLTNPWIAQELGVSLTAVEQSARRLIAAGRIERAKRGPKGRRQATIKLDNAVAR